MSLKVDGFKVSELFQQMKDGIETLPEEERKGNVKKVNGTFQFEIKNSSGKVQTWSLDMKNGNGAVTLGPIEKPDITIIVTDDDFADLASGKLNGQKAFMSGKIKVKGKMMLATKLDTVLKTAQKKSKL